MLAAAENSENLAMEARDRALEALLIADDLAAARKLLGPGDDTLIGLLDAALNGSLSDDAGSAVRAYREAQLMATYTLEAE